MTLVIYPRAFETCAPPSQEILDGFHAWQAMGPYELATFDVEELAGFPEDADDASRMGFAGRKLLERFPDLESALSSQPARASLDRFVRGFGRALEQVGGSWALLAEKEGSSTAFASVLWTDSAGVIDCYRTVKVALRRRDPSLIRRVFESASHPSPLATETAKTHFRIVEMTQ